MTHDSLAAETPHTQHQQPNQQHSNANEDDEMKEFFTPKEVYYMALTNDEYLKDHHDFIEDSTRKHLVDQDKIEYQIKAILQGLLNEERRLNEYKMDKCMKYYADIAEDYQKWKTKTESDSIN
jgi:hypothetical protein